MISATVYRLIGMYSVSSNGTDWYNDTARPQLIAMSQRYGVSYRAAAGVYAALSPGINANVCFMATERLLMQRHAEGSIKFVPGFKRNLDKALEIARGEAAPLDVLKGPKVRAFYQCLVGTPDAMVVDGHMINAWLGKVAPIREAKCTEQERKQLIYDFKQGAVIMGVEVREFQARVWNEQRKLLRASTTPEQAELFVEGETNGG